MKYSKSKINGPDIRDVAIGIYGTGGFAREVIPLVNEYVSHFSKTNYQIFFVEDSPQEKIVNGYPVISHEHFFDLKCGELYFNIAIGDSKIRERIANECIKKNAKPLSLYSKNSVVYECNDIDDGAIFCSNTIVTSNAKIGKFFHLNIYSYVAHDCVIGDFVTFAPNVHCNGNVHICNHAYIGTGAVIKQGTQSKPLIIGEGATVGMGAVVTKDVEPHTTVVGNPAKPVIKS
jgi:sugar O-acyltransferase (sialic acid O-acetyltransferase NeuD family)